MHPAAQRQLDHLADIQKYSPGQAAALSAAQTTRQQLKPPPDGAGNLLLQCFGDGEECCCHKVLARLTQCTTSDFLGCAGLL